MEIVPEAESVAGIQLTDADLRRIREYLVSDVAESTQRAYRRHWSAFEEFCAARGARPIGCAADAVAAFLTSMAEEDCAYSSVEQARAAICKAHTLWNARRRTPVENPTTHALVKLTMKGIKKKLGAKPTKKMALTVEQVRAILGTFSDEIRDVRDRAMIALGIMTGMRRSELCSLTVDQLTFEERGLTIVLGVQKTDQAGERGDVLAVPSLDDETLCPVALTRQWLDRAGIVEGAVYRGIHPQTDRLLPEHMSEGWFVRRLKQGAEDAGLPVSRIGGHSLRAGFITEAVDAGVPIPDVATMTRHRSYDVLKGYYRKSDAWKNPPAAKIGL